MTILTNPSQFKEKRELTDGSLISERVKTDESLKGNQKKAEQKTDKRVKKARLQSDKNREQDRKDSDLHPLEEHNHHVDEDNNLEEERLLMDAVIRDERDQKKNLLNKVLHKEREETDLNLSLEREDVDIEVERSSKLFSEEFTSHSETKTALTSRDELLAIVSHDLRNPIGAVVSCSTHLLESNLKLDDEMQQWIKFIKRNAESSLRLIRDILDMERFAEGKLQIVKTPHSLDELITDSMDHYVHLAMDKNIKLSLIPSSISLSVNCDGDRISQVLSNLIGNALKFTPQDGSVSLGVQKTKAGTEISISDTGPGIPDDEKLKIFSRFTQINNRDRSGLGLGLYISKMLIEAHQGRIWVTSTPTTGSIFTFLLPE